MPTELSTSPVSQRIVWTGRILTSLSVLFLLMDSIFKIIKVEPVLKASAELDIPEWVIPRLGCVLLTATLIYAIPKTSIVGAIILTGYLGGATWTHVRMGGPIFPIFFPTIVTLMVWGGIYLREPRLWAILPLRWDRNSGA